MFYFCSNHSKNSVFFQYKQRIKIGNVWKLLVNGIIFSLDFEKKPKKLFVVDLNIWFKF